MAWEERGSNKYYYRKHREDETVMSEYVGRGIAAELQAMLDEHERTLVEEERRKWRADREAERETDCALDEVGALVRQVRNAILLANGYHSHKGQWRQQQRGTGN